MSLELPLVICDIQRGGPSTGLPTKTEQSDLFQACSGATARPRCRSWRRSSPADCFDAALEAARIAVTYRTPVFLLSDGYLANGSEPWRIPDVADLPDAGRASPPSPNGTADGEPAFLPYLRDPRDPGPALGRARHPGPGAPDRRHREAGRHRQHLLRPGEPRPDGPHPAAKVAGIDVPDLEVDDPSGEAKVLVLGWGSTYGPIQAGVPPGPAAAGSRWPRPTCAT